MEWVIPGGAILLWIMPLFFTPAAIGIIDYLNELWQSLPVILLSVFFGIAAIIFVTGGCFQMLTDTKDRRQQRKKAYIRARNIKKLRQE